MEVYRISSRLFLLLGIFCLVTTLQGVQGGVESEGPSESECRPYIEKALKELETAEAAEPIAPGDSGGESKEEEEESKEVEEEISTVEITTDDSDHVESDGDNDIDAEESKESTESATIDEAKEEADDDHSEEEPAEETSSESQQVTSAESETEDIANEEQSVEELEEEIKEQEESDESPQSVEVEETTASEEEHSIEEKEDEEHGSDDTDNKSESVEVETSAEDKVEAVADGESVEDDKSSETDQESIEAVDDEEGTKSEEDKEQSQEDEPQTEEDRTESAEAESAEAKAESAEAKDESAEAKAESAEADESKQKSSEEEAQSSEGTQQESTEDDTESAEGTEQESAEEQAGAGTATAEEDASSEDDKSVDETDATASAEEGQSAEDAETDIVHEGHADETEDDHSEEAADNDEAVDESGTEEDSKSREEDGSDGSEDTNSKEDDSDNQVPNDAEASAEIVAAVEDVKELEADEERPQGDEPQVQEEIKQEDPDEVSLEEMAGQDEEAAVEKDQEQSEEEDGEDKEITPEEELINEGEIPENLRPIDHISQLLKLDDDNLESEKIINGVAEITLRDLKKLYENAIKPLEVLYKYRDLSNRHFGDAEIFSKPLVLFMGPWSGGKSSIVNYLLNNEYNETSLRTGAEPSPAYFNILMYGEEPEVVDGTQLAADFTFSGLQKFGQGLEERLRGLKLPQKLLQKINIVEIPGILEVRKQISRVFPFNDACQWFIDRADIIFLVYDPSKLDVGPETEAILDQLKGREHQTRIILNKADQVKPEELMRVQGALIWNISPLMSSAQPPVMYTTSLWSKPYEIGAPIRLLQAQERAFLRDLRSAVDKRIENKIASARRFAVRVRNHAKMVDCYLTTYYNHKSVFGNRKQVSDAIIEHPQDYHIYEGLSTLTNISRYDLPDPDVYRDFFRLNPLYDFQQLSATCTYFRGCPINRLDVAIAYDLPELVGKHKRMIEAALAQANLAQTPGS